MPARLLVGIAASAALAGFLAGAFRPRAADPVAGVAPPAPAAPQSAGATPPPARHPDGARPRVPPGILSRAASARALERGACQPPAPNEPPRCAHEARESIDIDWHVSRDP